MWWDAERGRLSSPGGFGNGTDRHLVRQVSKPPAATTDAGDVGGGRRVGRRGVRLLRRAASAWNARRAPDSENDSARAVRAGTGDGPATQDASSPFTGRLTMCGIVGYVGPRQATPILLEGLRRLEYRGYDSAGVAVQNGRGLGVVKLAGRVAGLRHQLETEPLSGTSGIAHTRWATHGAPTQRNAHPHLDCPGRLALVHHGIIENAGTLRQAPTRAGHPFTTDTDTETLVHLIEDAPGATLEARVNSAQIGRAHV